MIERSLALVALACTLSAHAQISFGGEPRRDDHLPQPPTITLPMVDVPQLMEEDAARLATGMKGPYRFGFTHTTDLGTGNSGR